MTGSKLKEKNIVLYYSDKELKGTEMKLKDGSLLEEKIRTVIHYTAHNIS